MDTPQTGPDPASKYKTMKAAPSTSAPKTTAPSPNYTPTSDPDTYMGKHGVPIKRTEYQASLQNPKNNMKFNSFEDYADYVGGYAKPTTTTPTPAPKPAAAAPVNNQQGNLGSGYHVVDGQRKTPTPDAIKSNWNN